VVGDLLVPYRVARILSDHGPSGASPRRTVYFCPMPKPPRPVIVETMAAPEAANVPGAAGAASEKGKAPAVTPVTGKDPDGFTSAAGVRRHVEALWVALADSLPPALVWKSTTQLAEGSPVPRGYFLAGAALPGAGAVRYHLSTELWSICPGAVLDVAPSPGAYTEMIGLARLAQFVREQAARRAREEAALGALAALTSLSWADLGDRDKVSLAEFVMSAAGGQPRPMVWALPEARDLPAESARQLAVDVLIRLLSPQAPIFTEGIITPVEMISALGVDEWVRLLVLAMTSDVTPDTALHYLAWGDLGDPDRTAVIQYAEAARLSSWSAAQEAGLPEWRRVDIAARPRVEQVAAADRVLARLVGRLLNESFTPDDVVDILGPVEWNRLLERVVLGQARVEIIANS